MVNPLSGARLAFMPGWLLAAALLAYALSTALRDGFC